MQYKDNNPFSGSIICYYRKNKSKILLEKNKNEIEEELTRMENYYDSEKFGEDKSICSICFEKKIELISLTCNHIFCDLCIDKYDKCPICRKLLIKRYINSGNIKNWK